MDVDLASIVRLFDNYNEVLGVQQAVIEIGAFVLSELSFEIFELLRI
jgi:hypothetical protein